MEEQIWLTFLANVDICIAGGATSDGASFTCSIRSVSSGPDRAFEDTSVLIEQESIQADRAAILSTIRTSTLAFGAGRLGHSLEILVVNLNIFDEELRRTVVFNAEAFQQVQVWLANGTGIN